MCYEWSGILLIFKIFYFIQIVQLTLDWNYYKYVFEQFFLLICLKESCNILFEFHILQCYKAVNLCPCVWNYYIYIIGLIVSSLQSQALWKKAKSLYLRSEETVVVDPAEVTRIVNIVRKFIPSRIPVS